MIVVKGVNGVTLGDPLCVLLLAAGSNKGGVEVTPQSKRLSVSTVHSDSSLHDHTGEENR